MGSAVSYAQVKAVFTTYGCSGCHTGPTSGSVLNLPAGMDLTQTSANTVYTSLVNVSSLDVPAKKRVQPFSSSTSFLYEKVNCSSPAVGTQMPDGGPTYLSNAELRIVRDWINQGASSSYKVTSSSSAPLAGVSVTITAQLQDMLGNAYGVANRTITWSSSNGGSFQNPTSTTNASGTATVTFTPSTVSGTVCKITATDTVNASPLVALTGQSANITTQPGAANKYVVTSSNFSPIAGASVTITAQLQDAFGNNRTDTGATITWTKTGGGSFSPSNTSTVTNGVATVTLVTGTVSGTAYTVTASDGTHNGTTNTITSVPGAAVKYLTTPSTTTPNAGLAIMVTAQLKDINNNSVSSGGHLITWTSTNGGSFNSGNTSTTNPSGTATINFTTSTVAPTVHTVTATSDAGTLTGTTANITTQAGAGIAYSVTPSGINPVAGTAVTMTAQLLDNLNNPVHASGLTITWTSTNGGSFSPPASTTDINGSATTSFTTSTIAPTIHKVTATDNNAATGTSANITTKPGSAALYVTTSSSSTSVVGGAVSITAQLADANNNPVATSGLTVNFTSTNGGAFSVPTQTDASGIATVSFTVSTVAGTIHTVTAKDTNNLSGTSGTITATTGAAAKYLATSNNNSPIAGNAVTLTAQLADSFGNPVKTANLTVNWSSDNGGTFFTPSSITDSNGTATIFFTTGTTAGSVYAITASDSSNHTGTTANITAIAGAAAKYLVGLSSSTPIAGSAISVTAQLADANSNPVGTAGVAVFWSTSQGGTFSVPSGTTNGSGIATVGFTTLSTVGSTTVTASNNAGIAGNSPLIVSIAGPPLAYVVTSDDTTLAAGASINISAQLADINGNAVSSSGVSVSWQSTGASGGTLSPPTSSTNAAGISTVSFTASTLAGSVYTLSASDTNSRTGTSSPITAIPNSPAKFLVGAQSSSAIAGSSVVITAQLADTYGNSVALAGVNVIWSKSGTGGSLSAINSATSAAGVATVTLITSKVAGVVHTVSVQNSAAPASAGTSGPVTTIAGPATQLAVSANTYAPVAGETVSLSAQFVDAVGNPVKSSGTLVTWSGTGTGTLSANTSATDTNGNATIQLTTGTKAGQSVITAASAGGITGTSQPINSTGGTPTQIILSAGNSNPPAGAVVPITAQLVDANGNPARVSGVSITWGMTGSADGTFTSPSSPTDSTGLASVQFSTSIVNAMYTITADGGAQLPQASIVLASPPNSGAPQITSPLQITPPPGTQLSYEISSNGAGPFTVFATGLPAGLTLSGNTIVGTPSVSGIFMVNLTVVNSMGTDYETLVLSVNGTDGSGSGVLPYGVFSPLDSDGDGIPDVLETFAETDPKDPRSKPVFGGTLQIDQMQVKLAFSGPSRDKMNAVIRVGLPEGYTYAGSSVGVKFGGFTHANISIGPTGSGSDSIAKVTVKPVVQGATVALIAVSIKNADLQTGLSLVGITNDDVKAGTITIPVALAVKLGATTYVYTGYVPVVYNAKKGKSGSAIIVR